MKSRGRYDRGKLWLAVALLGAVLGLVGTILDPADAARTDHRVTLTHPGWVPPLIRRLSVCESRGNPRHHVFNREGEFGGIVSWYVGTWQIDRYTDTWADSSGRSRGMPLYPWNATLRQQVRVAARSLERGRYFGCLNHAWVRG